MARASCYVCIGLLWLVCPLTTRDAAAQAVFFEDNFDATQIDPLKWRTEDVVAGMRWCDPNAGSAAGPGSWVNPATESCYGVSQSAPFGTAVLDAGLLSLGPSPQGRTFPYLASRVSPFPAAGEFSLVVRMRYDHRGAWGNGLAALRWDDTSPSGDNAPDIAQSHVFGVWADPGIRVSTLVRGFVETIPVNVQDPDSFHDYEVRYESGAYTFLVDGLPIFGPATSTLRPSALWIGNPVFSYWGPGGWSTFTVDYVRVEVPAPTASRRHSWGALKTRYR